MNQVLRTIPTKAIQNVILTTLLTRGGKATPVDVYGAVETQFPKLTRNAAKNLPYNVRWARLSLATQGFVKIKTRGTWLLTAAGRKEARSLLAV